jgi:ATP adenylyltransferase
MKHLYAPWRNKYVKKVERGKAKNALKEECIFCQKLTEHEDEKHFILARFKYFAIMLNLYPYNAGHILIVTLDHINHLKNLTAEARNELMALTNESIIILEKVMDAQGINVGINIGKAGGAGIPNHLHTHVLPRWIGDTNFLPTLTGTKQISVDLPKLYQQLKPHFQAIKLPE